MLIAIDHGNYAIKTPHHSFVSGLSEHTVKPPMADEILEYDGRYWTPSGKRLSYMRDKTQDERYFILTLFAIAKELEDMAVNASQSKNLNIDVKQAKQELLLKKQSLQSQIVNDVDSVHQKNQKMADESGKRLSRLQRSRYIREKQSSDLQTKIETERRQYRIW